MGFVYTLAFYILGRIYLIKMSKLSLNSIYIAQSAGAVEYTNYISAEGYTPPHECPRYDAKQSDGEAPVILELWRMQSTPSLPSLLGSS